MFEGRIEWELARCNVISNAFTIFLDIIMFLWAIVLFPLLQYRENH